MVEEFLELRNTIHKGKFRFALTPSLWESHYISMKELEAGRLFRVVENGELKGYAVFHIFTDMQIRICEVQEICAKGRGVFTKLVNRLVEKCIEEKVDFVFLRHCEEPYEDLLTTKGFLSLVESAIMIVLLNPKELLLSLSQEIEHGKILKLIVRGFEPIFVKVGKEGVQVLENGQQEFTITTDSETFLRLLFGKTSFLKEVLRRKVVAQLRRMPDTIHFFELIKAKEWYIPSGDWY